MALEKFEHKAKIYKIMGLCYG